MMTFIALGCAAVIGGVWAYVLRRRKDVMSYHDIETPRITRHREGGV